MSRSLRLMLLLSSLTLAACDTTLDVDVAADPADGFSRITLPLDGVVLQRSDSTENNVRRSDVADVNLLQFDGTTRFDLVSGAEIDEGDYRGARLLLGDDDGELVRSVGGGTFPIDIATSPGFAEVDFSINEDERSTLTLALDLRLSLALRDGNRYLLSPVLRAVRGDGADVSGFVAAALLAADACDVGAAIYLYPGEDVEPQERDGSGTDPLATAPVRFDNSRNQFRYSLRFLPEGSYTLALTCDGEREDGIDAADPDLIFGNSFNLDLDASESATLNFSN